MPDASYTKLVAARSEYELARYELDQARYRTDTQATSHAEDRMMQADLDLAQAYSEHYNLASVSQNRDQMAKDLAQVRYEAAREVERTRNASPADRDEAVGRDEVLNGPSRSDDPYSHRMATYTENERSAAIEAEQQAQRDIDNLSATFDMVTVDRYDKAKATRQSMGISDAEVGEWELRDELTPDESIGSIDLAKDDVSKGGDDYDMAAEYTFPDDDYGEGRDYRHSR